METVAMWGWGEEPIWPCKPSALKRRPAPAAWSSPPLQFDRETVEMALLRHGQDFAEARRELGLSWRSMQSHCRRYRLVALRSNGQRLPTDRDALRAHLAARFADGATLQDIGLEFGVTRERIRQVREKLGVNKDVVRAVRRRQRRELRIACGIQRLPDCLRLAIAGHEVIPRGLHRLDIDGVRYALRRSGRGGPWKPHSNAPDHPGYWHFSAHGYPSTVDYVLFVTGDAQMFVVPRAAAPLTPNIPAGVVHHHVPWLYPTRMEWERYRDAWPWKAKEGA